MYKTVRYYLGERPETYARETCAFFTGHRSYQPSPEDAERLDRVTDWLFLRGVRHFYAGGALGFDLCAEIAICNARVFRPELTLTLALPFCGYSHRDDAEGQSRYRLILERADEVVCLRPAYSRESYIERNHFMADRCDWCVAYLEAGRAGGTASAVRYAQTRCRHVYNLCGPIVTSLR